MELVRIRARSTIAAIQPAEGDMTIDRALLFSILMAAIAAPRPRRRKPAPARAMP
jgi:hypothetical protein